MDASPFTPEVITWLVQQAGGPALVALGLETGGRGTRRALRGLLQRRDLRRRVGDATGHLDLDRTAVRQLHDFLASDDTWQDAAGGTWADLADSIADKLAELTGKEPASLADAGEQIAAELVTDIADNLTPAEFHQLVYVNLQHIRALLNNHPAGKAAVADYLTKLVTTLGTDTWTQAVTRTAHGEPLTLDTARIERKLSLTARRPGSPIPHPADADEAARTYQTLVILGGPGAGKTWFARRTARLAAQQALDYLRAGASLDQVEVPLYATCTQLFAHTSGHARTRMIAAALDHTGIISPGQPEPPLHAFFQHRTEGVLAVLDSLDEAVSGVVNPPERALLSDLADNTGWRVLLTSRPEPGGGAITLMRHDTAEGTLEPLSYPDDVEAMIRAWLPQDLAQGLSKHISKHPQLADAATVPLICAMYCLIADDRISTRELTDLPDRRAELYDKVINRLWRGHWHDQPTTATSQAMISLEDLAWRCTQPDNPTNGLGHWPDEPTASLPEHIEPLSDTARAIANIAPAVGPEDPNTNTDQPRRFIHRTIWEHLVARYINHLPTDQAVVALEPHLWHDPTYDNVTPMAIADHDHRTELLANLLRCDDLGIPPSAEELDLIDGGLQLRLLIARLATETIPDDWPAVWADFIDRTRIELASFVATYGPIGQALKSSNSWPGNAILITRVLDLLPDTRQGSAAAVGEAVVGLATSEELRQQALTALVEHLPNADQGAAGPIGTAVAGLAARDDEIRQQALTALIGHLSNAGPWDTGRIGEAIVGLATTEALRARSVTALISYLPKASVHAAGWIGESVVELNPTEPQRAEAITALAAHLSIDDGLTSGRIGRALTGLATTEALRAHAVTALVEHLPSALRIAASRLGMAVAELAANEASRTQAVTALVACLPTVDSYDAAAIGTAVSRLDPNEAQRLEAMTALAEQVATANPLDAGSIGGALAGLGPNESLHAQAITALAAQLPDADWGAAERVGNAVVGLATSEELRAGAFTALAANLPANDPYVGRQIGKVIAQLAASDALRTHAIDTLVAGLPDADSVAATAITELVAGLDRTDALRVRAMATLLEHLPNVSTLAAMEIGRAVGLESSQELRAQAVSALLESLPKADPSEAVQLGEVVTGLDPSEELKAHVITALIQQIPQAQPRTARLIGETIVGLAPNEAQRAEAIIALVEHVPMADTIDDGRIDVVLGGLASSEALQARAVAALLAKIPDTDPFRASRIGEAVVGLDPNEAQRAQAARALVEHIPDADPLTAMWIGRWVTALDPSEQVRAQAVSSLAEQLPNAGDIADYFGEVIAKLDPSEAQLTQTVSAIVEHIPNAHPRSAARMGTVVAGLQPSERLRARAATAIIDHCEQIEYLDQSIVEEIGDAVAKLVGAQTRWEWPELESILSVTYSIAISSRIRSIRPVEYWLRILGQMSPISESARTA